MPKIVDATKQIEWKFANALSKFLPGDLEWRSIAGYPILYQKGFWGSFKGCVAFLTGNTKVTIERREWKATILEALHKYEAANRVTIDAKLDF